MDFEVNRRMRIGKPSVMDDATEQKIQETRQESEPARMAGVTSLFSQAHIDRDVDRKFRSLEYLRSREGA